MLEHQNTSLWTRSGIRDEGEGECLGCGGHVGGGGTGWVSGGRLGVARRRIFHGWKG